MKDTAKHQNLSQFAQLNSVNSSSFYLSIIVPYMMFLHFQTRANDSCAVYWAEKLAKAIMKWLIKSLAIDGKNTKTLAWILRKRTKFTLPLEKVEVGGKVPDFWQNSVCLIKKEKKNGSFLYCYNQAAA